jgi:general secretion pathway protein D
MKTALLGLLLGTCLSLPAQAQNQPRGQPQEGVPEVQIEGDWIVLNFSENPAEQLSLQDFVKLCQEVTGHNFTYDQQTQQALSQGRVVMFGSKRIPKSEFYNFFQIQLFINEFVCIEVGPPQISVILIQSLAPQAQRGASTLGRSALYVSPTELDDYLDQPATLIITVLNLQNIDARQLQTQLRAIFTDPTNTQQVVPAGERSLILQGFGSYIAALARLLRLVDQESAVTDAAQPVFDLVPLEFAAAEDVADLIEQLLEAQRDRVSQRPRPQVVEGQGVSGALQGREFDAKILVDARTNSLLIMALPDDMPRIKDLVARLDVEVIEPERNFHVYSLQNVKAKELADVLDEFLSGAERLSGQAQGGTGGRPGAAEVGGGGSASARTSNEVIVVPDEASNALLIAANKTRYEEVLELIRQLDERQDQVLIESALIELSGTDFRDIGVEWALADTTDDGGFGATNFGLSDLQDSDLDGVPDTRIPVLSEGVVAGILSGDDVNLPFLLAAASRTEGANVLNVPSVLVNNNGSAKVVTLDQQPTTQVTATGVGGQTQTNFAGYQDAGITLEISPSISASRYLRLDISLQVSNFTGTFDASGAIPPPRTTREMKTTVNVPDGDTMVIGGVIADVERETREGVPWLADLPLLGFFFRRDVDSANRVTLYFFVTPHILRDPDFADLSEISYQKKLSAAEIMGKNRLRVVDPDFGMQESAVDFGSFQVPLYRSEGGGEVDPEELGLDPLRREELLRQAREAEPQPEPQVPDGK